MVHEGIGQKWSNCPRENSEVAELFKLIPGVSTADQKIKLKHGIASQIDIKRESENRDKCYKEFSYS